VDRLASGGLTIVDLTALGFDNRVEAVARTLEAMRSGVDVAEGESTPRLLTLANVMFRHRRNDGAPNADGYLAAGWEYPRQSRRRPLKLV
jgi:hypothetical protein